MSAIFEIDDNALQGLERDCAAEIVNRIMAGDPAWFGSFKDDADFHADIVCVVGEALLARTAHMGTLLNGIEPLAKKWAEAYVLEHPDVQDLAFELGGIIEEAE